MSHRFRRSLAALALVDVLVLASVAHADEPLPAPKPPKPMVMAPPTDVDPGVATGTSPPSAEPDRPYGRRFRGEQDGRDDRGGVSVTITSSRPHAMLFRSTSTGYVAAAAGGGLTMTNVRTFVPVCAAPCRITTDENATYRIGGEGVTLSDEFRLPAGQGGNVDLKVTGGSLGVRRGGAALIGTGVPTLLAGAALLIAGYIERPDYTDAQYQGEPRYLKHDLDDSRHLRTAGFIVAPLGAVMILAGSIMAAVSGTTVETGSTRLASTPPKPTTRLTLDGFGVTF